jgi:hypothetical protein
MPPKKKKRKPQPKLPLCDATNNQGLPCGNIAGKGTDHKGVGKCFQHGGRSPGAAKGNKHALKTGEFERLHFSALEEDEQQLYDQVDVGALQQSQDSIRLLSVREQRMLYRIKEANELLRESRRHAEMDADDPERDDMLANGLMLTSVEKTKGKQQKGFADFSTLNTISITSHILTLEDALNRIQATKLRAIASMMDAMKATPQGTGALEALSAVIRESVEAFTGPRPPGASIESDELSELSELEDLEDLDEDE